MPEMKSGTITRLFYARARGDKIAALILEGRVWLG